MPSHPDHEHHVRRVVLPSGKTIEVVYFEDVEAARPAPAPAPRTGLHVCPECTSELVYPVEWEEAGPTSWAVSLRCPNCEWRTAGTYDQATVELLDERLDDGTEAMVRDLKELVHANMEHDIERFVEALSYDLLRPEDF